MLRNIFNSEITSWNYRLECIVPIFAKKFQEKPKFIEQSSFKSAPLFSISYSVQIVPEVLKHTHKIGPLPPLVMMFFLLLIQSV